MPLVTSKKKKKKKDKFWSDDRLLTNSIKFKICISQVIAEILLKQPSLNQIRHCLARHIEFWHLFLSKNISISVTAKIQVSEFYD